MTRHYRRLTAIAAMVALACACGCRGDKSDPSDARDDDRDPPAERPAGPFGGVGMLSSLFAANAGKPGPYDDPRESANFDKTKPHLAVLELRGSVVELTSISMFGSVSGVELFKIQRRLRELAADEAVAGLLLRFDGLTAALATAEELRRSIVDFKSVGGRTRAVHCHTESTANVEYYVMTACDTIAVAPTGGIILSGVSAMPIHLKGLLDKVGVRADFLHVGAFKGAAEPLTREQPSRQMMETLNEILDDSFATLVDGVAEGRKLGKDAVRTLVDTAVFDGEEAVSAKLSDKVAVFESYRDQVGASGWRLRKISDDDGPPSMAKLMSLLGLRPRERPTAPHVAIVYAVGNIVDGEGDGKIAARQQIASRPLAAALRILAHDDSVKAVVLRVNSGGGSALSSEFIWHAAQELKAKKPFIVSMGDVAASGGYYISCGATKIYAQRTTLTGSIGVVGGKLAVADALAKVGVTTFPIGRGKRATMWTGLGTWNSDARSVIQATLESIYKVFVNRVAEGRGKNYEDIHAIAQGRVWTGEAAMERGLVDELGGLDAAVAEARRLGQVDADAPVELYPPDPTLMDLLGSLGTSMPTGAEAAVAEIRATAGPAAARVVAHILGQLVAFRDAPIQTTLLLPVVFH